MWVGCPFSFDPWGQRRSVDNYNTTFGFVSSLDLSLSYYNKGFTGHEQFDDSGLVHMNGRIYDPRLGRFLSVDPMVQQEYNLQNLNRHSYVLNNPLNATDPSGYFWAELFSAVAEYFASDSFAQSISMAGISYASNGGVQFTYSSADAFSYGQGRSGLLSHNFLIVMIWGGRSRGLAAAKAEAHLSGANVTSGVIGGGDKAGKDSSTNARHLTHARMARAVYTVTDFDVYNEGQLNIDGYLLDSIYEDDTGIKAALFVNGDDKVLAFAGTDLTSGADWSTNGNQAYGDDSEQYDSGIRLAASISGNLVLTGHSMGGGIAAAAAIITGRNATIFNAADVHTNTLRGFKYKNDR